MSMRCVRRTTSPVSSLWLGLCAALGIVACSPKDNPGPNCPPVTNATQVSYMGKSTPTSPDPNSAYGIMDIYCQGCHASTATDRRGAPIEVVFDTYDDTVRWAMASDELMANAQMPPPPAVLQSSIVCAFDNWVTENFPQ